MKQKLTEDEIKEIAAQLRKPEGELGIEVGNIMNEGNKQMNLHALNVVSPSSGQHILEVGMGNGAFVKDIVEVDNTIYYTGYDYSQVMVNQSIINNKQWVTTGQVQFICGDVHELPFGAASFDTVFTINTFYFWKDYQRVFEELKRVLKDDGQLIICVRPKHNLDEFPMTKYGFAKFSVKEIVEMMKKYGFGQVKTESIKEPEKEQLGKMIARESVVLSCKKL